MSVLGRSGAGPAIAISLLVAALACGFAALCYAELASMIPVSGSAYTIFICDVGRDHRVDHRLGFDPGICGREHGGRGRLVGVFR